MSTYQQCELLVKSISPVGKRGSRPLNWISNFRTSSTEKAHHAVRSAMLSLYARFEGPATWTPSGAGGGRSMAMQRSHSAEASSDFALTVVPVQGASQKPRF